MSQLPLIGSRWERREPDDEDTTWNVVEIAGFRPDELGAEEIIVRPIEFAAPESATVESFVATYKPVPSDEEPMSPSTRELVDRLERIKEIEQRWQTPIEEVA